MSRPTGNSRYCEDGRKQLHGNIKHAVYKAAVKIHIYADTFINLAFLAYYFLAEPFNRIIKSKIAASAFFVGKLLSETLKHLGAVETE